jgi:uncharacterized protein YwbE
MADLNLDDLVLLIHTEIASAITSAQHYGAMESLSLDSVRVRMGQEQEDASVADPIRLNDERYPIAQNGWLIDVTYRAGQSLTGKIESGLVQAQWTASQVIPFLASQSVKLLDGVGKVKQAQLQKQQITTIGELVKVSREQEQGLVKTMGAARFRGLKTMARLALAVPPVLLPESVKSMKLRQLLDQFDSEGVKKNTSVMTDETRIQLLYWLEQLEFCLDDDFFHQLTFNSMLGES